MNWVQIDTQIRKEVTHVLKPFHEEMLNIKQLASKKYKLINTLQDRIKNCEDFCNIDFMNPIKYDDGAPRKNRFEMLQDDINDIRIEFLQKFEAIDSVIINCDKTTAHVLSQCNIIDQKKNLETETMTRITEQFEKLNSQFNTAFSELSLDLN